jgi:hypothetical protein
MTRAGAGAAARPGTGDATPTRIEATEFPLLAGITDW